MQRTATRFSLPCFLVLLAHVEVVTAVDFRIESRVFVEKEDEPVSTSTTLFKAGLTYDFLENPRETTFLDPRRGRIVLLDATHGLKTEIRIAQIVEFATQLKLRAAGSEDALLQFLAEPKFQETWDSEGNELVLSSKLMTYRVTPIKAPSAEVAKQYQFRELRPLFRQSQRTTRTLVLSRWFGACGLFSKKMTIADPTVRHEFQQWKAASESASAAGCSFRYGRAEIDC